MSTGPFKPPMTVYLDHNATTPPSREVRALIHDSLDNWGNASSIHFSGRRPKSMLREARQNLARLLKVDPLELVFTSGGTESNNLALKGLFLSLQSTKSPRDHLILSHVEHPSVRKTAEFLQKQGVRVSFIDVSRDGEIDLEALEKMIDERTALVSVMLANNETGHILPVKKIAKIAHAKGAMVHTDAVQALGKIPLDLKALDVDMASFSGHKFYALKGAGVLYVRRGVTLEPLLHGGGQERHRRGGTENTLAMAALGAMALTTDEMIIARGEQVRALRDLLETEMVRRIPQLRINGRDGKRIPNTSSLVIPGVDGETLLISLDIRGFAVSTGAACSSGSTEPSPALLAMGLTRQEAQSSLRLSLGWNTTAEELERFVLALEEVVAHLRSLRGQTALRAYAEMEQ